LPAASLGFYSRCHRLPGANCGTQNRAIVRLLKAQSRVANHNCKSHEMCAGFDCVYNVLLFMSICLYMHVVGRPIFGSCMVLPTWLQSIVLLHN